MINEEKLDNLLLELGHDDFNRGTAYIRAAVRIYEGQPLTKELYPAIARTAESTPGRIERCMRHSIDKAWSRGDNKAQLRCFGYSVNPDTGHPTVGEYISRLRRLVHEN